MRALFLIQGTHTKENDFYLILIKYLIFTIREGLSMLNHLNKAAQVKYIWVK
ncbi:hypothetical protein pb186bvf_014687 [Paramecium bursaria]